jgi:hypothetical protein
MSPSRPKRKGTLHDVLSRRRFIKLSTMSDFGKFGLHPFIVEKPHVLLNSARACLPELASCQRRSAFREPI